MHCRYDEKSQSDPNIIFIQRLLINLSINLNNTTKGTLYSPGVMLAYYRESAVSRFCERDKGPQNLKGK